MPNAGNSPNSLANLAERLKSKTEENRQITEKQIKAEFESLSLNVRESMKNALATIENAINREIVTMRESMTGQIKLLKNGFIKFWLVCGLLGLGLICGMVLGGWGLASFVQRHVINLRQDLTDLNHQKARLEITLKQLESKTWGLSLIETPEGRFIILPPNATLKTGWKLGKQPAAKLE